MNWKEIPNEMIFCREFYEIVNKKKQMRFFKAYKDFIDEKAHLSNSKEKYMNIEELNEKYHALLDIEKEKIIRKVDGDKVIFKETIKFLNSFKDEKYPHDVVLAVLEGISFFISNNLKLEKEHIESLGNYLISTIQIHSYKKNK